MIVNNILNKIYLYQNLKNINKKINILFNYNNKNKYYNNLQNLLIKKSQTSLEKIIRMAKVVTKPV